MKITNFTIAETAISAEQLETATKLDSALRKSINKSFDDTIRKAFGDHNSMVEIGISSRGKLQQSYVPSSVIIGYKGV